MRFAGSIKQFPYVVPFLLSLALLVLYLHSRTAIHSFDALSYTQDLENKTPLELYHPHHLLYGPAGRAAQALAEGLGYQGRADRPAQALNALAGALGVLLIWATGYRLRADSWKALPPALGVALAYAYWAYAAEVEVYTLAAACLALLLYLLQAPPPQLNPWLIGLAHAGAVMFHQTNLLLGLPLSLFFALSPALRPKLLPYWLAVGAGVALPYLGVAYASGFRSPDEVYRWLTDYAQTGIWGGNLNPAGLRALLEGLLDTLSPASPLPGLAFYALALGGLLGAWKTLTLSWRALIVGWLGLYAAFFWWWEPWNIEFWIALLPLWAYLVSLNPWRFSPPTLLALSLALAVFNYPPIQKNTNPANDYYRGMTEALRPELAPGDVVITRGNILDLYLPFYADHPPSLVWSGRSRPDVAALLADLDHAYHRGQVVYIDALMLDEARDPARHPFGWEQATIADIRARYPLYPAGFYDGRATFYSLGQRSPATATAWDFAQHLGGWVEFGAEGLAFRDGAWCLTGGADPWLESPPLALPAEQYPVLEIRLNLLAADPGAEGQVFWARAGEGLSEDRSLKFALQPGPQVYRLDLAANPAWGGEVVALRLDPIQGGRGGVCVGGMRWLGGE
jgi:hypothetical protein